MKTLELGEESVDHPRIITGAPVRGADFYGRSQLMARTWETLSRGNVLLTAPRRHGKTSVMYGLVDNPAPGWLVAYADVEYLDDPSDVLETILAALLINQPIRNALATIKRLPKALLSWMQKTVEQLEVSATPLAQVRVTLRSSRPDQDWLSLGGMVSEAIDSLPKDSGYAIILDEFPIFLESMFAAAEEETKRFLQWFRAIRQSFARARFLIGGSINLESNLNRRGYSSLINDLELVRLRPFVPEVANAFVRQLLQGSLGPESELTNQIVSHICETVGEGVPFYLQLVTAHFVDAVMIEGRPFSCESVSFVYQDRVMGPDCRSRFDHYRSRLRDYYRDHEEGARMLLCILADGEWHADAALSAVLGASGLDDATGDKTDLVLQRLESDYYVERRDGKTRFLHRVLADWWRFNIRPPRR